MRKHSHLKRMLTILSIVSLIMAANLITALAATPSGSPDPTEYAHILNCALDGNGQIVISGYLEGVPSDSAYYDGHMYLFELKPYEDSIGSRTDYCGRASRSADFSFSVSADLNTTSDRIYSKFVVAFFDGYEYIQSSNEAYVTNPEILAKNTQSYQNAINKRAL